MAQYKGKKVTTRELSTDDPRFDKNVPKIIVIGADGKEEVVAKSEVSGNPD